MSSKRKTFRTTRPASPAAADVQRAKGSMRQIPERGPEYGGEIPNFTAIDPGDPRGDHTGTTTLGASSPSERLRQRMMHAGLDDDRTTRFRLDPDLLERTRIPELPLDEVNSFAHRMADAFSRASMQMRQQVLDGLSDSAQADAPGDAVPRQVPPGSHRNPIRARDLLPDPIEHAEYNRLANAASRAEQSEQPTISTLRVRMPRPAHDASVRVPAYGEPVAPLRHTTFYDPRTGQRLAATVGEGDTEQNAVAHLLHVRQIEDAVAEFGQHLLEQAAAYFRSSIYVTVPVTINGCLYLITAVHSGARFAAIAVRCRDGDTQRTGADGFSPGEIIRVMLRCILSQEMGDLGF